MKKVICALGILTAGLAQAAPNNTGRGFYAHPMPEKTPDTSVTVKLVKVVESSGMSSAKEQDCGGKGSPTVSSMAIVGFDEAGTAKVSSSKLEIKDCAGVQTSETFHLSGSDEALEAWQAKLLSPLLASLKKNPKDCAITLKLSNQGKLLEAKGCTE